MRIQRTQKATLTHTFFAAESEDPASADGDVTVTVTAPDGTTDDSGTATGPDSDGAYSYAYPGSDQLNKLTVSWTGTFGGDEVTDVDDLEVVGEFFFSLVEGRKVDSALSSTTKYTTADLAARRIEVEDECERICGQAFVPRYAREVLDGTGRPSLILRWPWLREIRSISIRPAPNADYVAMTADQLANVAGGDDGVLRLDDGFWPSPVWWTWGALWPLGRRNIIVEYEHGRDRPTPDIVRGAKIRFKSLLLQSKSALPDRAERIATTEMGTVLLASPSRDSTGIPEVDAAYAREPDPRMGFG